MINSTSVVASSNNNNTNNNAGANPSQTAPMPPQPQTQSNQPGIAAQTANQNAQTGQNSAAAAIAIQQKLLDRDIVNLVYHLIKDNPDGCERFSHQLVDKVETFLSPFVVSALYHTTTESSSSSSTSTASVFDVTQASLSSIRFEMILLGALMQKQFDDSSWEQLLRVVVHVLLRSLSVANLADSSSHRSSRSQHKQQQQPSQNYNNPVIIECLTLPCLRIINNMCKLTSNVSYLTNLISTVRSQKSTASNFSTTSSAAVGGPTRSSANNMGVNNSMNSMGPIGRYFSEPGDPNPQVFLIKLI